MISVKPELDEAIILKLSLLFDRLLSSERFRKIIFLLKDEIRPYG